MLLRLSYEDLNRRRLPNPLVTGYGLLSPLALLASGASATQWMQHGVVTAVGFVVLVALFALRALGGGDVKLGTAVLAWTDVQDLALVLLAVSLAGLMLALLGLLIGAPCLKRMFTGGWRRRVRRALLVSRGVPYGVALSVGGLCAMPAYWVF